MNTQQKVVISQKNHYGTILSANKTGHPEQSNQKQKNSQEVNIEFATTMDKFDNIKNQLLQLKNPHNQDQSQKSKCQKSQHPVSNLRQSNIPQTESAKNVHFQKYENHQRDQYHGSISSIAGVLDKFQTKSTFLNFHNMQQIHGKQLLQQQFQNNQNSLQTNSQSAKNLNQRQEDLAATMPQQAYINHAYPFRMIKENQTENYFEKVKKDSYANKISQQMDGKQYTHFMNQKSNSEQNLFKLTKEDIEQMQNDKQSMKLLTQKKVPSCSAFQKMLSKSNENQQKMTFLKQNQIGQPHQLQMKENGQTGIKNMKKDEDEDATNNLYFQVNVNHQDGPQPQTTYTQTERYNNNTPLSQNRGPSFISNDSSNKKQKYADQLSNNQQYQIKKKLKINMNQCNKNTYANSEQMKSGVNSVLEMNNNAVSNHGSKQSQIYFKNDKIEQGQPQKVRNSVDHKYSENQLLLNTQNVYNSCQKMNKDTGFESPFEQDEHSSQMAKAQNLITQLNCQPSNIIRTSTSQKRIPETKTLLNTHKINQQYLTQRKYSKDNSQKNDNNTKTNSYQRQSEIDGFGNNQKENSSYQNEDTINVKSLVKEAQKMKKNNQKIRELLQNTSISLSQLSKNSQFVKHQDNIIHQLWSQNENDKNSQTRMLSNAFQENQSRIQVQKLSFFSKNTQLDQVFQIISKDISLIDSDLNKIHYQMMNSEENLNQLETGLKNLLHTYPQSTLNQILSLQDSWKNLKKENKYFENQLNLKIAENEKLEKLKKELDDRLYLKQFQSDGLQKMLDECRSDNQLLIKKVDMLQQNLLSKQKKKSDAGTSTQELFKIYSELNNDKHLVLLCQTKKFLEAMENLQKSLNLSRKSQQEDFQIQNRKYKQKFEQCKKSLEETINENIQFLEKEFENSQNENQNLDLQKYNQSEILEKNKLLNQLDGEISKLKSQNSDLASIIEEKDIFIHKLKFKEDNLQTQNKLLQNQTTILQQQIANLNKNLKGYNDEAQRLNQIKKYKQTQTIVQKIKKVKKSQVQILDGQHLSVMPDLDKLNKQQEQIRELQQQLAGSEENVKQQSQEKQQLSQQLVRQEQSMDILKQQIQSMQDLQIELQEQSQIVQKDQCINCGLIQQQIQEQKIQMQDYFKQITEISEQKSFFESKIDQIFSFFQNKIDLQNIEVDSKIRKVQKYLADLEQTFQQKLFQKDQDFALQENIFKNNLLEQEQQFNSRISQSQQNHNEQIQVLNQEKIEEISKKQALIDQLQLQINENQQKYLLESNQFQSQSQLQITELQNLNQQLQLEKSQTQSLFNQQYNELLNKRNQIEDNFREHLRIHQDCQSIIHQLNENLKNMKNENESLQEMVVQKEEEIQKEKEDLRVMDAERADLEISLEKHVLTLSENRELISMLKEQVKKSVDKQKEQTQIISIQKDKILSLESQDQVKVQSKNIESQTYETAESIRLQNEDNMIKQSFLQLQISNLKIQFSDKFSDSEEQIRKIKFINEEQEHQLLAQERKLDEYQNYIQQFKDQMQNILINYGIQIDQKHENQMQICLQHIEKIIDQQNIEIENLQQIKVSQGVNEQRNLFQACDKLNQAEQALIQSIQQNRVYKDKAKMKIKNYKRFIDQLKEDKQQEIKKILQEQHQTQQSKNNLIQDQLKQKVEIIEFKEKEIQELQFKIENLNQQINLKNKRESELKQINEDLINEFQKERQAKGNIVSQFEQSDEDSSSSKGSEIEQLEIENMGLINKLQNSEKEIQNLRDQIYALKHSNNEGQMTSQESQNLTLDNINKIKNLEQQFLELKNIILNKHIEVLQNSANNFIQSQFEEKIKQTLENFQNQKMNEESEQKLQIIQEQKDDLFLLYNDLIDMRIKIEDNIDLLDEKELVIMKDDLQYYQSENVELKLKVQALIIKNNHMQIQNEQNQKLNGDFHFKQILKDSGKNAVDISSIDLEIANNCDLLEQSQNMIINNSLQSFKELSNQNIEKENESSIRSSQLKEQESQVIEIKSGFSQSLQKIENSAEVSKISEQIDELINQALCLQDQQQCKQQLQSLAENVKQQIQQLKSGSIDENKPEENNSLVSDSSKKSSSSQYQNLMQHIKATLIIYLKKNPIIDTQNESLLKIIQSMMKFTQDEINDLDQARKKLPVYVVDQSYQKKLQNLMSSKKSNNEPKKNHEQMSSYKSDHKQNQIDEINNFYGNDGEDGKKPLSKAKKVFQGLFAKRSDSKQNESRNNNESQYSSHQKNLYQQTAFKQKDFVNNNYQDDEIPRYGSNSSNK